MPKKVSFLWKNWKSASLLDCRNYVRKNCWVCYCKLVCHVCDCVQLLCSVHAFQYESVWFYAFYCLMLSVWVRSSRLCDWVVSSSACFYFSLL